MIDLSLFLRILNLLQESFKDSVSGLRLFSTPKNPYSIETKHKVAATHRENHSGQSITNTVCLQTQVLQSRNLDESDSTGDFTGDEQETRKLTMIYPQLKSAGARMIGFL